MSHIQQRQFCIKVRYKFPLSFQDKKVLDVGSLDINGNNRYLCLDCDYTGIDLGPGRNVDIVCPGHEFAGQFDTIISTEAFEHDLFLSLTLHNIIHNLLVPGGLFLFTCAGKGRKEHGTADHKPKDSPFTHGHYRAISEHDVRAVVDLDSAFSQYEFEHCLNPSDLYFWGVKK